MFTRVKMGVENEIHRCVYASVVRTGKGNKRILMLQGNRGGS